MALHRSFYETARLVSGLPARSVTLAFKDWVRRRRGDAIDGLPLDEKLFSIKGIESVSIATLNGRVTVPFRVEDYGEGWTDPASARLSKGPNGFELMVSRPQIVTKRINDQLMEPSEILTIDIPESFVGTVIERLGPRKGEMVKMANHGSGRVRMEFKVPSRGLIGLRNEMLTETRGTIVMNSIAGEYIPYTGEIPQRPSGALISDRQGVTTLYALDGTQERGILFLGDGVEVYEGMIIGEHSRDNDLDVNVVREKKLTNMRASSSDEALRLAPARLMNLEQAIEFIAEDELVEVTPKNLRLRKKVLQANQRPKRRDKVEA